MKYSNQRSFPACRWWQAVRIIRKIAGYSVVGINVANQNHQQFFQLNKNKIKIKFQSLNDVPMRWYSRDFLLSSFLIKYQFRFQPWCRGIANFRLKKEKKISRESQGLLVVESFSNNPEIAVFSVVGINAVQFVASGVDTPMSNELEATYPLSFLILS